MTVTPVRIQCSRFFCRSASLRRCRRSVFGAARRSVLFRRLLVVIAFGGMLGCSTLRTTARRGVGYAENTERSYWTRVPATLGAALGEAVAFPFTVALLPSYPWAESYGWGIAEPVPAASEEAPGDYAVPLAGLPSEYAAGLGAAIFGAPFAVLADEPIDDEAWSQESPQAPDVELVRGE